MNHTYIKWNLIQWTANCFTVSATAVYIKMICIIETWNACCVNTDFKYLFILHLVNIKI